MGWNHTTHNWYLYEKLRPSIINVRWTKGGKEVFKSVNFAGYIGVYNGLKQVSVDFCLTNHTTIAQGAFTVTMNERFNINGGFIGLLQWLLGLAPNVSFSTFLVREVMETANTFDHAIDMLMTKVVDASIVSIKYVCRN
jgi:acid ceramidase